MKKILKSLFVAGAVMLTAACSKDQIGTLYNVSPDDSATDAYFKTSAMSAEFLTTDTEGTVLVDIFRTKNEGEVTVGLDQVLDEGAYDLKLIDIPESVTFADGEYKASIPVKVQNIQDFALGATYTATISVGDYHEFKDVALDANKMGNPKDLKKLDTRVTDGSYASVKLSVSLILEWENFYALKDYSKLLDPDFGGESNLLLDDEGDPIVQTASYTYAAFFAGDDPNLPIQRAKGTRVFRLRDWAYGVDLMFSVDASEKVNIDGKDFFVCHVGETYLGYDHSSYGPVYQSDLNAFAGASYDDYPCYWDGNRTFVFTMIAYVGAGNWGDEVEYLVLDEMGDVEPEIEEPAPAVAIKYLGGELTDTGIKSHTLSFTPNSDAARYFATIVPVDPEIEAAAISNTNAFLESNGIAPGTSNWYNYFDTYYELFYEMIAESFAGQLEAQLREAVEGGQYTAYPVLERTGASTDKWQLGEDAGTYTAVAFSYDASGEYTGVDFKVFNYNPDFSAEQVSYYLEAGTEEIPYLGYFASNSIYFFLQADNGDLTKVQYALVTEAEFADCNSNAATTISKFGKTMSAADLAIVNSPSPASGGYEDWLPATPATAYKLVTAISTLDATKYEVTDCATEPAVEKTPMTARVIATNGFNASGYYAHTHLVGVFEGNQIAAGASLWASVAAAEDGTFVPTNADLAELLQISKEGVVTAKKDKEAELIQFIKENGSAFSTGSNSDLYRLYEGNGQIQKWTAVNAPNTWRLVLGMAVYSDNTTSWCGAVGKTAYAPEVAFEQIASANGKNIDFTWVAAPTASIFVVTKVEYALLTAADFAAAGVNTSLLSDEQLNNFAARQAAGTSASEIDAQKANAAAVEAAMAPAKKTFQGDAAKPINDEGVQKRFENVQSGTYYLVAKAYDKYNTKLTVAQVTVQ